MTNSNARLKADSIIHKVFELTDEEYLRRWVDGPIEKAAAGFGFNPETQVTHQIFIRVTGEFVRHVHEHGLKPRQILSDVQARTEATAILEEGYQNPNARGYYASFLDASNPNLNGLEFILDQMTQFIIARARERHIRWVYSSRIDPSDWPTKCLIAQILIERWGAFLPSSVLSCTPAQLADFLAELFDALCFASSMVRKALGAEIDLSSVPEMLESILPLSGQKGTERSVLDQ
jgi:hypothetical protein